MIPCPSLDALQRLLVEDLSLEEHEQLESHVQGCPTCQAVLDDLTALGTEPAASPDPDPEPTHTDVTVAFPTPAADRFLEGQPIRACTGGVGKRLVSRAVTRTLGLVVVLLGTVGGIGLLWHSTARVRQQAEPTPETVKESEQQAQSAKAEMEKARPIVEERKDTLKDNNCIQNIRLAQRELEAQRPTGARIHLDACPVELRRWEWGYLDRLARTGPRVLVEKTLPNGQIHPPGHLVFSSDGKQLWLIRDRGWPAKGRVEVWDTSAVRTAVLDLAGDEGGPIALALRKDGNHRIAHARLQDVVVRSAVTGQEVRAFPTGDTRGLLLALDAAGEHLATVTAGSQLQLWKVDTGKPLFSYRAIPSRRPRSPVAGEPPREGSDPQAGADRDSSVRPPLSDAVAVSPGGSRIALVDEDANLHLFDPTGNLRTVATAHTGRVGTIVFSPDGKQLATASSDRTVRVWDWSTGRAVATLVGHSSEARCLAFSPDGKEIATGSGPPDSVKIWNANGQQRLALAGHTDGTADLAFDGTGRQVACVADDGRVLLWDLDRSAAFRVLESDREWKEEAGQPGAMPPAPLVRVGGEKESPGWVELCDPATGQVVHRLEGHSSTARPATLSRDGRLLATASWHAEQLSPKAPGRGNGIGCVIEVFVWDVGTGKRTLEVTEKGSMGGVLHFEFNDRGHLAAICRTGEVFVWDIATGRKLFSRKGHQKPVSLFPEVVKFSPDGRQLVFTSLDDEGAEVWDYEHGVKQFALRASGPAQAIVYHSDGERLATAGQEGNVAIWDARLGQVLLTLSAGMNTLPALQFSRDGRRLLARGDGRVIVWETADWTAGR